MTRNITSLILVAASIVLAPLAASAAPITVPADLNPGDQYRLVFVTSTSRDATSSFIADYNAFVTTAANSVPELAALGTTWKAIASAFDKSARQNTGTSGAGVPIYRLDEVRIANNYTDLWDGSLLNPLDTYEYGGLRNIVNGPVWTGTIFLGANASAYLGTAEPMFGTSDSVNGAWIQRGNGDFGQSTHLPLYAMSDVLTVVPEPSTMVLACLAAAGLAVPSLRRRRHGKPAPIGRTGRAAKSLLTSMNSLLLVVQAQSASLSNPPIL